MLLQDEIYGGTRAGKTRAAMQRAMEYVADNFEQLEVGESITIRHNERGFDVEMEKIRK